MTWQNWLGVFMIFGPLVGVLVWLMLSVIGWQFVAMGVVGAVWVGLAIYLIAWD
jgi:hypothetical protein